MATATSLTKNREMTTKLVGVALLTAIVIVLQLLGSFIRFGIFSVSLVLVPIVIGAALFGAAAGAWLGFVFGMVVLISGDATAFMQLNAFGTVLVVLAKGTLAGYLSALIYKLVEKKNKYLAVLAASFICPLVNTGVFTVGCLVFFLDDIKAWAGGDNLVHYFIFGLGLINFVAELALNLILNPAIVRIVEAGKKTFGRKS